MMRIGILFGGFSREREIAFAGGRTVYDNLNKALFDPIPVFIDSFGNLILLDWEYVYKGSIRDFYPDTARLPHSAHGFSAYAESLGPLSTQDQVDLASGIGKPIRPEELADHIDFAFLALHGNYGEDGIIQGMLESLGIPYSGSGILPSAVGIDKAFQKKMMAAGGFECPSYAIVPREQWIGEPDRHTIATELMDQVELPLVVKPAHQGSSVGVTTLSERDTDQFIRAVSSAFFIETLTATQWSGYEPPGKVNYLKNLTDIRTGIGLPVMVRGKKIYHPEDLLTFIDRHFSQSGEELILEATDTEAAVILEAFVEGTEFSCIVIQDENRQPVALPPTEIIKGKEVFDYRSKYLSGLSRKVTPIDLPDDRILAIRQQCEALFRFFGFNVYARIDGFIRDDGSIILNDPNTTSGMLPSSFFFHQAAEIGLGPGQFLTYIIRTSLDERIRTMSGGYQAYTGLLEALDRRLDELGDIERSETRIGVIMGGYSSERHISIESGRNVYEKLASSSQYDPIPIFLSGSDNSFDLTILPVNLLLKDNADDIREKIQFYKEHPVIRMIRDRCQGITARYGHAGYAFEPRQISLEELRDMADGVFIALHGRPGEDGRLQSELDKLGLVYNGSSVSSSRITINKYETNEILKKHGFNVADHLVISKNEWQADEEKAIGKAEGSIAYPFIAKPVDDGCSSAVKLINDRTALKAFARLTFREEPAFDPKAAAILDLKPKEEFPQKEEFLIEERITAGNAKYFLEITGGLLTHIKEPRGGLVYEIFEPSEALATKEVLSLEEKFLAGQGQNITPARFGANPEEYKIIADQVKKDLEQVARILEVTGYARIDAFVRIYEDLRVETIVIEVNSLPGMTPATCIFHQSAINGYKPFDFIHSILTFGFNRQSVQLS